MVLAAVSRGLDCEYVSLSICLRSIGRRLQHTTSICLTHFLLDVVFMIAKEVELGMDERHSMSFFRPAIK